MKKTILLILILMIGIFGTALSVDVFADKTQENKNGNEKSVKAQDFSAALVNPTSSSDTSFQNAPKEKSNGNNATPVASGLSVPSVGGAIEKNSNLSSSYDKLSDKVQANGSVRIIVGLNIDFKLEGEFSTIQEKTDQQKKIQDSQNTLLQTVPTYQSTTVHKFKYIPYLAMTVNKNSLDKLASSTMVKSIYEDKLSKPSLADSIPLIGANILHTAGFDGSGKFVAIADTGVDITNSFFDGKTVYEACFSSTGQGQGFTFTTLCPNGLDEQIEAGSAVPCTVPDQALFGCDHGTHVAGIAVGNGPPSGVAPGANLVAIQIYSSFDGRRACGHQNSPCALTFTSDQIAGAEYVLDLYNNKRIDIVSMNWSLGGEPFTTGTCDGEAQKAIVDSLRSVGIATVAAAGNDFIINAISAPACISSVFSVGATNDSDIVADFSNTGAVLDVLAPGFQIVSSVPGGLGTKSGTSMASPHVAGAWALFKQASPPASVDDISLALTSTGVPIIDNRPATCCGLPPITKPRIQLDAALAALPTVFCGRSITTFNVIQGSPLSEKLSGTPNDDLIFGGGGDDQIIGHDGDDCIFGDGGNDTISGGNGNDTIEGGAGDDQITGRAGNDIIFGNDGNDVISGGNGNDTIEGGLGDDQITGRAGNDILHGNEGNDIISAGFNDDTVYGESGNDQLSGNGGNDSIDGGPDTDICSGGTGTNTMTNCE